MSRGVGKLVVLIGGLIVAGVSAAIGWCCRGKKENKRHAKTQHVILKLEERLRKVEAELADVKDLSISRIKELKAEKQELRAQIATTRRAA